MESKIPVNVRIAGPSDTKVVARLCRRAVGPGDYALRILRDVIAEKGLFLAWSNAQLVGMTNLDGSIDGSAWMNMARTDRNGVGRESHSTCNDISLHMRVGKGFGLCACGRSPRTHLPSKHA